MIKDRGFRQVLAFKSIHSRGEIEMLLFKNEQLFDSCVELLESQYTLTILYFKTLDKHDEYNFTHIRNLDEIDGYLD